jgi:hypothetical protein
MPIAEQPVYRAFAAEKPATVVLRRTLANCVNRSTPHPSG